MQQPRPFWFLLDVYGWVVLGMSIITAVVIGQWWMVLLGISGYLLALLVIGGAIDSPLFLCIDVNADPEDTVS